MNQPWWFTAPLPKKKHDLKFRLPGFETFRDAVNRRRKLVRALRSGDKRARKAARMLRHCYKGERCGSPVCAVCLRRFRRWFVGEVIKALGR